MASGRRGSSIRSKVGWRGWGEGAGQAFAKRAMRLRIQVQQRHRSIRSSIASMEGRREARGFGSLSL